MTPRTLRQALRLHSSRTLTWFSLGAAILIVGLAVLFSVPVSVPPATVFFGSWFAVCLLATLIISVVAVFRFQADSRTKRG